MQTARSITVGSCTPWGTADHVEIHENGIVWVSTPSHGGFYVPPHLNTQIPAAWRAAGYNGQPDRGWYEEDVDWCMVALIFPSVIDPKGLPSPDAAQKTFDYWIARTLQAEG